MASNTSVPYPNTISYQADSSGNWRILVARICGEGDYTLTITVTAATPPYPYNTNKFWRSLFSLQLALDCWHRWRVALILVLVIILVMRKKR